MKFSPTKERRHKLCYPVASVDPLKVSMPSEGSDVKEMSSEHVIEDWKGHTHKLFLFVLEAYLKDNNVSQNNNTLNGL